MPTAARARVTDKPDGDCDAEPAFLVVLRTRIGRPRRRAACGQPSLRPISHPGVRRNRWMAEHGRSADHGRAAWQGGAGRVLHLHLHQLAADITLRAPLAFGVWASGPADHRRPHARVRIRARPSICRERHPRAGRTLPHRPGQRVPNLGRMGQSSLAVVLRSGPGWTGSSGSRRRGICPGDRGRHSQPARPCARRLEGTSSGRCRPVPRCAHPRSISAPGIPRRRTAHSRPGKARQPTPSPSPAVPN